MGLAEVAPAAPLVVDEAWVRICPAGAARERLECGADLRSHRSKLLRQPDAVRDPRTRRDEFIDPTCRSLRT
jgi:hypothetical protein